MEVKLTLDGDMHVEVGEAVPIPPDSEHAYAGPYEVSPTLLGFTLETKGKQMSDDLDILGIPISDVGNESNGRTIVIG